MRFLFVKALEVGHVGWFDWWAIVFLTDYCTWDGQSFRSSTRHQIGTKFCKVMWELVEKTCDVLKNLSSLEAQLFVFSFLNMDQELLLKNTIGTFNAELTKSQNLIFFPRRNDASKDFFLRCFQHQWTGPWKESTKMFWWQVFQK